MSASTLLTLGTRGSALALAQANQAGRLLAETQGWEIERVALQVIRTSGDVIQADRSPRRAARACSPKKSTPHSFVGAIDAAVYSAKDLPSLPPAGVTIAAILAREDARDALISAFARTFEGLPNGATFGAASIRRQAQALRLRPDLKPVLLRGNAETRLRNAEGGAVAARPCSHSLG